MEKSAMNTTITEPTVTPGADQTAAAPAVQPILLNLEGVRATPTALKKLRTRVDKLNSELAAVDAPFRLRLMESR
jgi:hypothetical protein